MASYNEILADLKSELGTKKVLSTKELAPYISKSPHEQAMLRSRNKSPIPTLKMGRMVFITDYDLAKFLAGEFNPEPPPVSSPTLSSSRPIKQWDRVSLSKYIL